MKGLLQSRNTVFLHFPGVNSPKWPEHIKNKFFRDVQPSTQWKESGPERDWIYLELNGTTFSGHSTKTTLGNTLRTLCYAWYYCKTAGISNTPWNSDLVFAIASGDDCVIFVDPRFKDRLVETIRRLSA